MSISLDSAVNPSRSVMSLNTPINSPVFFPGGTGIPAQYHNHPFSSRHTGGANFAFADGHIQFVRDSIDLLSYQYAGTRDGGDQTNVD